MMFRTLPAIAVLAGALTTTAALATPVPGFRQLETVYAHGGGLPAATASLSDALPAGTDMAAARHALEDAGAGCKPDRRDPETMTCLIHQFSFADRAADDIRWTIRLHARGGALSSLSADRYVDQHGT